MARRLGTAERRSNGRYASLLLTGLLSLTACGGGGGGGGGGSGGSDPSGTLSTITVTPDQDLAADGVASATIVVIVRDTTGHFLPGVEVEISATGTGNVVSQPPVPSNGLGAAAGSLQATIAGAKTLTITLDPNGAAIVCTAHPIVRFGARAHVAGEALYTDVNHDQACNAGDTLLVGFDQNVTVVATDATAFAMPVSGDSLGAGATMAAGPLAHQALITLGAGATLRTRQLFGAGALTAGSPSGIDVSGSIAVSYTHLTLPTILRV